MGVQLNVIFGYGIIITRKELKRLAEKYPETFEDFEFNYKKFLFEVNRDGYSSKSDVFITIERTFLFSQKISRGENIEGNERTEQTDFQVSKQKIKIFDNFIEEFSVKSSEKCGYYTFVYSS